MTKNKSSHIFSTEISAHVLSRNSVYFPFEACITPGANIMKKN